MEYILQNIVLPNKEVCAETDLYLRADKGAVVYGDKIVFEKNTACDFSTYFNSFSLNKWLEYTGLRNLSISLILEGRFFVEVYAATWFKDEIVQDCIYAKEFSCALPTQIKVPVDITKHDNIYFRLISLQENSAAKKCYYYTDIDAEELNPVDIDLVMCTFKREEYIKRNITLLKKNFLERKKYNASGHYNIIVVDNGQTLDEKEIETKDGRIKLYPNLNTGGSGGFSRGMIESLKQNRATHILFMDDDVLVQVEAFERTYNLMRLLKEEYKDAFLGGAMFRLDQKNVQHENLAAFRGNYWVSMKENLDVSDYVNVVFNEKFEKLDHLYGGWWYCCMPVTMLGLDHLPYPFFIRMDDMEFSIRNSKHWVTLNGISVWHEAFDTKYSSLMENYFMFRNNMVVNTIHMNYSLSGHIRYFMRRFAREIFRYDYPGAELLLDGVERFLEGPEFFKNVDTVEDLKIHGAKQLKPKPIQEITEMEPFLGAWCHDIENVYEGKLKKMVRFLTINGHLLPDCFFQERGYAEYGYTSNSKMYFCKKMLLCCDPNFDTGVILKVDRKRCFSLIWRYIRINISLLFRYQRLQKEYKDSFKEMTSIEFWKKYLKLDGYRC